MAKSKKIVRTNSKDLHSFFIDILCNNTGTGSISLCVEFDNNLRHSNLFAVNTPQRKLKVEANFEFIRISTDLLTISNMKDYFKVIDFQSIELVLHSDRIEFKASKPWPNAPIINHSIPKIIKTQPVPLV